MANNVEFYLRAIIGDMGIQIAKLQATCDAQGEMIAKKQREEEGKVMKGPELKVAEKH